MNLAWIRRRGRLVGGIGALTLAGGLLAHWEWRVHRTKAALGPKADAVREEVRRLEDKPSRIHVARGQLRVTGLEPDGPAFAARVLAPDKAEHLLRAGDRLADGVVKSIADDHVIVETQVSAPDGKPPLTRLLRFSPAQPLTPIALGPDTTRLTAPLFARPDPRQGLPDYWAWLNEEYGAGVTRENNAAGPLHTALRGLVDAGQTFFDEVVEQQGWRPFLRPWREDECPSCVRRLEANEKVLAAVAEAVSRPRYFQPADSGTPASAWAIPPLLKSRHAANALAGRAMLRLGRGDMAGAASDALTGQRLALRVGQSPLWIERLIAGAVRGISAPVVFSIAGSASLDRSSATRLLRELQALPEMPPLAQALDHYERFHALDEILVLRWFATEVGPGGMRLQLESAFRAQAGYSLRLDPLVYLIPPSAFDWDEALRLVNRQFDLVLAAQRAPSAAERRRGRAAARAESERLKRQAKATLETLRKSVRGEPTSAADIAAAAQALARTGEGRKRLAHLLVSTETLDKPATTTTVWNESEALFRLGVTALALAADRLEKGRYPESLDALAADLLPGRFAPSTAQPGYVLSYRSSPGGGSRFALTAVPEEFEVTGSRALCVDSTGAVRQTTDGSPPKLVAGSCDPAASLFR